MKLRTPLFRLDSGFGFVASLGLGTCLLTGCDNLSVSPSTTPVTSPSTSNPTTSTPGTSNSIPDDDATSPTNSGVNVRDRDSSAKTPIDQNENQKDINITADIRKQIVATEMSTNAHNVKIITQDGKVTLRGPVNSEEEKANIEKIALSVAGEGQVDNQIEVTPK
jgi:hyperosmotically inducible periplasmic protein